MIRGARRGEKRYRACGHEGTRADESSPHRRRNDTRRCSADHVAFIVSTCLDQEATPDHQAAERGAGGK
eukprot:CAMPEP_0182819764 /NCGR_PEP_ID=MMETSP0006_2-20121128/12757_1 /TAXON_ID=97485 /ORGANISM="Prymnesium parvum, Strain Texoma1" /LENGTH=68 /DNA_ID=CAMNT_0024946369 /DNA_START=489 /DNA_END=695 /DNA_ORIENTATION=+